MRNAQKIQKTLIVLLLICGCAQKPTATSENRIYPLIAEPKPFAITEDTLLIDARPKFEYALAHVPNSYWMDWQDFAQKNNEVGTDIKTYHRRLTLFGIGPKTPVVVIGKGLAGEGDEGRLAWTLMWLGVENVHFVGLKHFKTQVQQTPNPRENSKSNGLVLKDDLVVNKQKLFENILPKDHPRAQDIKVIDVRSAPEYLKSAQMDYGAIDIFWKEFLDSEGRVEKSMLKKLKGVGFLLSDKIYVLSDDGIKSAAVTAALRNLGFYRAVCYSGKMASLN